MRKNYTCIMCPAGCGIDVEYTDTGIQSITGNACKKGAVYAEQELINPVRNIATSILIEDGTMPLASVRLSQPIPKEMIFKVMDEIKSVSQKAPVEIGQCVISNILGTGSDVIITKNVKKRR